MRDYKVKYHKNVKVNFETLNFILDWESIRSSPRDELGLELGWTGLGLGWNYHAYIFMVD